MVSNISSSARVHQKTLLLAWFLQIVLQVTCFCMLMKGET